MSFREIKEGIQHLTLEEKADAAASLRDQP
jgi:hypothetical protein